MEGINCCYKVKKRIWKESSGKRLGESPVVISGIEHRKPRPRRPLFQRQPGEATARRGTKIMPFGNSDSLTVGLFVQGKNVSEKVKFPLLPSLPLGVHVSLPALTGKRDPGSMSTGSSWSATHWQLLSQHPGQLLRSVGVISCLFLCSASTGD